MPKTVNEALRYAVEAFIAAQISDAATQAQYLLCDLLNYNQHELTLHQNQPLTDSAWDLCRYRVAERIRGVPLQYLKGEVEFYHCTIQVSPNVLIPRQETELLVDKIVQQLSKTNLKDKTLWDVCTGSGCIGIALKKHLPDLKVYLSDISQEALTMAIQNAQANKVDVEFLHGDLLMPFKGLKTDFFVCNPPYISESDYINLDKEVFEFEPQLALLGGKQGIEFYRKLSNDLPGYLNSGGQVWFEIGHDQGKALIDLFNQPIWKHQRVEKDWSNQDRFFSCQI